MEPMISYRQEDILNALQSGPAGIATLAALNNAPEASTRRDIGALRRAGHNIVYDDGLYTLLPLESRMSRPAPETTLAQ